LSGFDNIALNHQHFGQAQGLIVVLTRTSRRHQSEFQPMHGKDQDNNRYDRLEIKRRDRLFISENSKKPVSAIEDHTLNRSTLSLG